MTNNNDNAEYISQIHNTVAHQGSNQNLSLFEYDAEDGNLHAKALIADRDAAYVGSANFTNYSLKEAIEIGFIVRGPVVEELTDFITTIQASSDTKRLDPRTFTS
jgi:phosphatidylserine/phosphatidylglycerophosphate/cardiolipin synthase-like enzyme